MLGGFWLYGGVGSCFVFSHLFGWGGTGPDVTVPGVRRVVTLIAVPDM